MLIEDRRVTLNQPALGLVVEHWINGTWHMNKEKPRAAADGLITALVPCETAVQILGSADVDRNVNGAFAARKNVNCVPREGAGGDVIDIEPIGMADAVEASYLGQRDR